MTAAAAASLRRPGRARHIRRRIFYRYCTWLCIEHLPKSMTSSTLSRSVSHHRSAVVDHDRASLGTGPDHLGDVEVKDHPTLHRSTEDTLDFVAPGLQPRDDEEDDRVRVPKTTTSQKPSMYLESSVRNRHHGPGTPLALSIVGSAIVPSSAR